MTTKFEAVLFDMDGVLADSETLWTEIDVTLLAEHGIAYAGEHKASILGTNFPTALGFYRDQFGLKASVEELCARRTVIARDYYSNRIGMYPSTREVVRELHEAGLKIGLATSAVRALAEPWLARHQLTPYFAALTAGDEVPNGKPAPDIYLEAARRVGADPARCLVVEDALSGARAGHAAGMTVFAIPDTRWTDPTVFEGLAHRQLKALADLPRAIAEF